MQRFLIVMAFVAGLAGVWLPVAHGDEPALVDDFDAAWRIVRDSHFDPDMNGVDWDAVRDELRPEALEAESRGQVRRVINEMLGRLGQSHFGLIPKDVANPADWAARAAEDEDDETDAEPGGDEGEASAGDDEVEADEAPVENDRPEPRNAEGQYADGDGVPGFDTRIVEGRVAVVTIDEGSPAGTAGVRLGWFVVEIGTVDIDELNQGMLDSVGADDAPLYTSQSVDHLLAGEVGTQTRVLFENADGRFVDLDIERGEPDGELVKFGNLPPILTEFEWGWLDGGAFGFEPDARIGVIRFNIWMLPVMGQFQEAMNELQHADGIVLDLRGNLGGIGGMAMGIGRYFFDEPVDLGTMKMRTGELHFNVQPIVVNMKGERVEPFGGPVAILIDPVSASTTEVFAGGMQSVGRARVFGGRSAGQALPALMSPLPSGDVLLHAMASFVTPSGDLLEDTGVVPDEPVALTRDALLEGRDPILDAAVRWLTR